MHFCGILGSHARAAGIDLLWWASSYGYGSPNLGRFYLSLEMLFLLFVVLVVLFVFVVVCVHSSRQLFTFCVVLPLRPMVSSASMPARTPRMTGWPMSLLSSNGSSIQSILSLMCFLDSEM